MRNISWGAGRMTSHRFQTVDIHNFLSGSTVNENSGRSNEAWSSPTFFVSWESLLMAMRAAKLYMITSRQWWSQPCDKVIGLSTTHHLHRDLGDQDKSAGLRCLCFIVWTGLFRQYIVHSTLRIVTL
eukprot:scpid100685/ scgid19201/ 